MGSVAQGLAHNTGIKTLTVVLCHLLPQAPSALTQAVYMLLYAMPCVMVTLFIVPICHPPVWFVL